MDRIAILLFLIICNSGLLAQHEEVNIEYKRNKDRSVVFTYEKSIPGSYFLFIKFNQLNNSFQPNQYDVMTGSKGYLFTLRPIDKNKSIKFSYEYRYILGKPIKKIDSLFTYLLPFKDGTKVFYNSLTNLGEKFFGKEPPKNYKAFQFVFDKSETVCAVRKGVVIKVVRNQSIDTTKTYSFSRNRNSVLIEHKDGTFAKYTGFNKDKIFVSVGDVVYPNTLIGELDRYDKRKQFQLRLSLFFLNKTKAYELGKSFDKFKSRYEYFNPYFLTTDGIKQLNPKEYYSAKVSEKIITKEFKRRELRKWKKKHRKN